MKENGMSAAYSTCKGYENAYRM